MLRFRRNRFLSLMLAVSLVLAPMLVAAPTALAVAVPGTAQTAADHSGADHGGHMLHAAAVDSASQSGCATHDGCGGQCCVGCGHCVTGVVGALPMLDRPQPVQSPVVLTLTLSSPSSILGRPPQA